MAAFKNKANGTWYVQFRYTDWKGERQQKLKRGFATKKEAQAWEREFLMQKQADVNMTFESFVQLYEKDIKPKLKLNTWLTASTLFGCWPSGVAGQDSFASRVISMPASAWETGQLALAPAASS